MKQQINKTLYWGETSEEEMPWEEAKKWCEEQGGRMPTLVELLQAYEDNVGGFVTSNYWSATEYVNSYHANRVHFSDGITNSLNKTNSSYVRCVFDQKPEEKWKQGDILVNEAQEIKILGVCGEVYFPSAPHLFDVSGSSYTRKELTKNGWKRKLNKTR